MKSAAILLLLPMLTGCGALASPATKTALDAMLPVAVDTLTKMAADRYGSKPDESTAVCIEVPDVDDGTGAVYAICRAEAAE